MAGIRELNAEVIHEHMLAFGDFTTPGAMGRRIGFSRVTVKAAFVFGLERGWYETRDSETLWNPSTRRPAAEYRAVPPS